MFKNWFTKLKHYFDPPQAGTIEYTYYTRTGDCNQCGQCCSNIYLLHNQEVIASSEHFEKLKQRHEDYRHFVPIEITDSGVKFRCTQLQDDNRCGIHDSRPSFCKKYPSEDTILLGGELSPDCSYAFEIKQHFAQVLSKTAQKKTLRPGKLLNDVKPNTQIIR